MSEWISVEDQLPPDDKDIWALCYGYFNTDESDPIRNYPCYMPFVGFFNRHKGWKIYFTDFERVDYSTLR